MPKWVPGDALEWDGPSEKSPTEARGRAFAPHVTGSLDYLILNQAIPSVKAAAERDCDYGSQHPGDGALVPEGNRGDAAPVTTPRRCLGQLSTPSQHSVFTLTFT